MAYNFFPTGYQQAAYPQIYPQNNQMPPQNPQPSNGIVWVQGIEGAKAHPVAAGQSVLLMDSDQNCLYLKSADQTGMPTLRVFDYKERIAAPQEVPNGNYVTKEELEKAIAALEEKLNERKVVENE